jgi:hypothetical protein
MMIGLPKNLLSRTTTIRISADIWHRGKEGIELLLPSSALRIADHLLHASGLLSWENSNTNNKHDWFCVTQAVKCFPVDRMHEKSAQDANSSLVVTNVGTSSLNFGNTLTLNDETVAAVHRVFCRVFPSTNKSAAFDENERNAFSEFQPSTDISSSFPKVERFDGVLPETLRDSRSVSSVLSVKAGPQHINFANHVDHAFIAEIAHHALYLINKESEHLAVNYLGQPHLGDVLECFDYDDKIYITRTETSGEKTLVAIAK